MREVLKALVGSFSKRKAFKGEDKDVVCLREVRDKFGNLLTDHVWLTMGVQLKRLRLKAGEKISFSARSSPYGSQMLLYQ